jgi:hypothetical protein
MMDKRSGDVVPLLTYTSEKFALTFIVHLI